MKVAIVSKLNTSPIKRLLKKHGFSIVAKNPDFVISYGGDGTVLFSERKFPGIPKLAVKHKNTCHGFEYRLEELPKILDRIKKGKCKFSSNIKLVGMFGKKKIFGMNEVQIRAVLPTKALRFSVSAGNRKFKNVIADGLVVSTPFGSSGYYRAICRKKFDKGIGLAFNNPFNCTQKSFVLPEKSVVKVRIEREKAWLAADNSEKLIGLKAGDTVTVRKASETARFIQVR